MTKIIDETFAATGQSDAATLAVANVETGAARASAVLKGGVGTIEIQRSLDGGSSWHTLSKNADGDPASYELADGDVVTVEIESHVSGTQIRFDCTAYTSGDVTAELHQ